MSPKRSAIGGRRRGIERRPRRIGIARSDQGFVPLRGGVVRDRREDRPGRPMPLLEMPQAVRHRRQRRLLYRSSQLSLAERGRQYRQLPGSGRPGVDVALLDRKSVVSGKSVYVRVDLGGRRIFKKKKKTQPSPNTDKGKNT